MHDRHQIPWVDLGASWPQPPGQILVKISLFALTVADKAFICKHHYKNRRARLALTPRAMRPAVSGCSTPREQTPMTKPIPDGQEGLIPHLVCSPAAQAIDFYKKAFGAEEVH